MPHILQDIFIFSDYCWESSNGRIRNIALSLLKKNRVFIVESPILGMTSFAKLSEFYSPDGVIVLTPYLPLKTNEADKNTITGELISNFIDQENILYFDSWYFSATPWSFSQNLKAKSITYHVDKADDLLSPLSDAADSLFSSTDFHDPRCSVIADGVDFEHFSQARLSLIRPDDLAEISSPVVGCYGVYDESIIEQMATQRPDLQFVFLNSNDEIKLENVHYLGVKNFYSLPLYMSHWDIALTQFNDKHLFELLSAGKPTIYLGDAPVIDETYVLNANNTQQIMEKIDLTLKQGMNDPQWIDKVDLLLQSKSWDHQVELMVKKQKLEDLAIYPEETLAQ